MTVCWQELKGEHEEMRVQPKRNITIVVEFPATGNRYFVSCPDQKNARLVKEYPESTHFHGIQEARRIAAIVRKDNTEVLDKFVKAYGHDVQSADIYLYENYATDSETYEKWEGR
jgi:hypothetical protein